MPLPDDLTPQPRPQMDRHDPERLDPQPQAWRLEPANHLQPIADVSTPVMNA